VSARNAFPRALSETTPVAPPPPRHLGVHFTEELDPDPVSAIAWRMRGEVQQPATYPQARLGMTAVCKTVGFASSSTTTSLDTCAVSMCGCGELVGQQESYSILADRCSALGVLSVLAGHSCVAKPMCIGAQLHSKIACHERDRPADRSP